MPFVDAPLDVRKVGARLWRLLAPVVYRGRWDTYTVPAGYDSDFASVPRLLWILFPQSGRWDPAAVVHDWLITDHLTARHITSPRVDAEFREALKACGVRFVSRWLMWAGVRWAAVTTRIRRPGWLRTLPQLLLVTGTALAPVAAAAWALIELR